MKGLNSIRTKITAVTISAIILMMIIVTVVGVLAIRNIGISSSEQLFQKGCHAHKRHNDLLLPHRPGSFWFVKSEDEGFAEHKVTDISLYDIEDTSKLVWFTVPRATGKAAWLPPYETDNLGARVISYNIPVYLDKQFVGVIGIEMDYSFMAEIVNNITLYDDGYAFVNDKNGHDKGDIYLKETAAIICEVFDHSPVFRIGGDEFAALLLDSDYKNRDNLLKLFDEKCSEKRINETDDWEKIDVARRFGQRCNSKSGQEHV